LIVIFGIHMLELIGLSFKTAEINKEKEGVPTGIEVTVSVDSISRESEEEVLLYWTYSIVYNPDIGTVKIRGEAFCHDTPDEIEKLITAYTKDKIFPQAQGTDVLNMINANASINSIFLIRPFNLLPPFTPPLISEEKPPAPPAKK
jgi:hypothetical protein